LSDAPPRLINADTFIRVESADRFIDRGQHFRCVVHVQRRIDLYQATKDGLPFACVKAGQLLRGFPLRSWSEITTVRQRRQRSFHPQIAQIYADLFLNWTLATTERVQGGGGLGVDLSEGRPSSSPTGTLPESNSLLRKTTRPC